MSSSVHQPTKTYHGWQFIDAPLLGFVVIVDLDESDIVLITLVVNVLQLGQHLLRSLGVLVVEQHRNVLHLFDDHVQHLIGDVLDLIRAGLAVEPLEHVLLILHVTFVHGWDTLLEVNELGELGDAVVLGFLGVVHLDEVDAQLVALVVDVLQFVQDLVGFLVIVVV